MLKNTIFFKFLSTYILILSIPLILGIILNNALIKEFEDYIKEETLADELQQSGDLEWDKEKIVKMGKKDVKIAVKK